MRYGFLQRTSVYWPTNHEATTHTAGVATIKGHTAYQLPLHKTRPDVPPANRPGIPPEILTWPDAKHLQLFKDDVAALVAADLAHTSLGDLGRGVALGFWGAAAFQWVNPKAWAMALGAIAAYAMPANYALSVVLISLIFVVINIPSIASWVLFGQGLRRFLAERIAARARR